MRSWAPIGIRVDTKSFWTQRRIVDHVIQTDDRACFSTPAGASFNTHVQSILMFGLRKRPLRPRLVCTRTQPPKRISRALSNVSRLHHAVRRRTRYRLTKSIALRLAHVVNRRGDPSHIMTRASAAWIGLFTVRTVAYSPQVPDGGVLPSPAPTFKRRRSHQGRNCCHSGSTTDFISSRQNNRVEQGFFTVARLRHRDRFI